MGNTSPITNLSRKSQDGIIQFKKSCHNLARTHWNIRDQLREVDLAYARENDYTVKNWKARIANKYGDATAIQNYTVPVVMPHVETAVDYQVGVFLSQAPLFGCVASQKYEDAAFQMETILEEQAIRGGWVRELEMMLRDGFKYNIAAIEATWASEQTAAIETDTSFSRSQGKPKNIIWEGNKLRRMDMYNTIFDTTVAPTEIPTKGEFAGYVELMSRVALKAFINKLPDKLGANLTAAFESGVPTSYNYYIPAVNYNAIMTRNIRATTDWMAWAAAAENTPRIHYANQYEVTTLYGRIIPEDFGMNVPSRNTPQVWKFIFVNETHLIYAERQTNAHDLIPIFFCQPNEDGLTYQTKSHATNVQPVQEITSALMTSVLDSRRRAISDRTLYDPSRIREADINSPNPSAKIPVRPAAYGKPLGEAVYPFPFRDDQSGLILQEIPQFISFANQLSGQNQARQGQFVKGNKSNMQWSDTMQNATSHDQSQSLKLEAQIFTPLKEVLKINILQYQGGTELYNRKKEVKVAIDPIKLREAVIAFKLTDGVTTAMKQLHSDVFQTGLQVIGSSPQIGAAYNIAPLFSYLLQTQGANIKEFEKSPQQQQYEQAIAAWQQTCAAMAKANPALTQKQLPPQPQPAQFGLGTDGNPIESAGAEESKPTLIQQFEHLAAGKPATDGVDNDAAQDLT